MTFEEFFRKKKIALTALEEKEPALFAEFKTHYLQMGEKSFDHTKKYWFNKLRREYPTPPEIKEEKVRIENQLAEQTITEALLETNKPASNTGFVPRFKANIPKPTLVEDKKEVAENPVIPPKTEIPEVNVPKPAYKPRFNVKNIPPKTEE